MPFITLQNLSQTVNILSGSFSITEEEYIEYYNKKELEECFNDYDAQELGTDIALETANSKCLCYDYARTQATIRRHYTYNTPGFKKALRSSKLSLPRIDLFQSQQKGIWLDFDSLEALQNLLPTCLQGSWNGAARFITSKFSSYGKAIRSASGKVKVFIPVPTDSMDQHKARNIAKKLCGDRWFAAIDSKAGFRYSFINAQSYLDLKSYLKSPDFSFAIENNKALLSLSELKTQAKQAEIVTFKRAEKKEINWKMYAGELPDSLKDASEGCQWVFRFMCSYFSRSTASRGIDLPLKFMAELSGFSIRKLSVARRELTTKYQAIRRTSGYHTGVKADSFIFDGFYLGWARNQYQKLLSAKRERNSGKSLEQILEGFIPGNWNQALFELAQYAIKKGIGIQQYLKKVQELPGFTEKPERARQAQAAFRSYSRWFNRISKLSVKTA